MIIQHPTSTPTMKIFKFRQNLMSYRFMAHRNPFNSAEQASYKTQSINITIDQPTRTSFLRPLEIVISHEFQRICPVKRFFKRDHRPEARNETEPGWKTKEGQQSTHYRVRLSGNHLAHSAIRRALVLLIRFLLRPIPVALSDSFMMNVLRRARPVVNRQRATSSVVRP